MINELALPTFISPQFTVLNQIFKAGLDEIKPKLSKHFQNV